VDSFVRSTLQAADDAARRAPFMIITARCLAGFRLEFLLL
jgi:hypothetical protein